jgi:transcriptional regulator with XRE-family HTH domain
VDAKTPKPYRLLRLAPEEIKRLRKDLKLTARRLAARLGVDEKLIFAWESGERFPTKRHCEAMAALRAPSAPPRASRSSKHRVARLADPDLWVIVRKLTASPELFEAVRKLAAAYPDPADE